MARFILDEDMPRSTAGILRSSGHEVKDVRDQGLRGASDEEIFALAQREGSAILTGDRGFGNILRFPLGKHHGIIVAHFPNEMPVGELNQRLQSAMSFLSDDDVAGNVIVIDRRSIRIRRP